MTNTKTFGEELQNILHLARKEGLAVWEEFDCGIVYDSKTNNYIVLEDWENTRNDPIVKSAVSQFLQPKKEFPLQTRSIFHPPDTNQH